MKNILIPYPLRLGNFIIQVENAIKIALFYNYNIILPDHKYLIEDYIVINKDIIIDINMNDNVIVDENNFFFKDKIKNIDQSLFDLNIEKTNEILNNCFKFNRDIQCNPLGENDLLIHIRGGDIFEENGANPDYIVPPLIFYTNIIRSNKFNEIYLISEDTRNPCVNILRNLYPKIKFKIQTLDEDIKLILGATNIIKSYGTFIPALLKFSKKIKNLYKASYCNYMEEYINYKTHITDLKEYKQLIGNWSNSNDQKKLIINYKK